MEKDGVTIRDRNGDVVSIIQNKPYESRLQQIEYILRLKERGKTPEEIASKVRAARSYIEEVLQKGYTQLEQELKEQYHITTTPESQESESTILNKDNIQIPEITKTVDENNMTDETEKTEIPEESKEESTETKEVKKRGRKPREEKPIVESEQSTVSDTVSKFKLQKTIVLDILRTVQNPTIEEIDLYLANIHDTLDILQDDEVISLKNKKYAIKE